MGNSNTEWAEYANDPEATRRWDEYVALPVLPDSNALLNKFLGARGLKREDLMRVGAKWGSLNGEVALVFMFHSWRKYRSIVSDHRATDTGAVFDRMHVVKASGAQAATQLIIAEGETDAALLSRLCSTYDIAVLPAGALTFSKEMAQQAAPYEKVLVGTDSDDIGIKGAQKIMDAVPQAERLMPPDGAKDWCEAYVKGLIDDAFTPMPTPRPRIPVYTIRELIETDLGTDDDNSWFAAPIMPVKGEIVLHGPMKSYKSIIMVELLRAVATGSDFAEYIAFAQSDGPAKVLLFQFEVPPHWFKRRMEAVSLTMTPAEDDLYRENFYVYKIVTGELPRLRINKDGFRREIFEAVEASEAKVVAFDPVQRMAGGADINRPDELDIIFSTFEELMDNGVTVVYSHHDNKANRNAGDPYSMSGTQRFGADADSICSVYSEKDMPDETRNMKWLLRNGQAEGRSITVRTDAATGLLSVTYDEPWEQRATPVPQQTHQQPAIV